MKNDLSNMINKCEECQALLPSLPNDHPIKTMAKEPMEKLSIDLFETKGKHYMLTIDHYSGMPWLKQLRLLSTNAVTSELDKIFKTFRYPRSICSDGGPQFRREFDSFCNLHGIIHEK